MKNAITKCENLNEALEQLKVNKLAMKIQLIIKMKNMREH